MSEISWWGYLLLTFAVVGTPIIMISVATVLHDFLHWLRDVLAEPER